MLTLNCKGRLWVADSPVVMGIINATPDSFFEGSRFSGPDAVVAQADKMMREGAEIIDIGGQSTRPGSSRQSVNEELSRVIPCIQALHRSFPDLLISVDTFYAEVAEKAVAAGASLVNDTSAGSVDPAMIATVAAMGVPYVLMHMQGTPEAMQANPQYDDVTREVLDFFIERIPLIKQAGVKDIIVDPGFGFGKTIQHNFQLLAQLQVFQMLNCPIMVGISRKSTIYKTLGITASEALNGTTVLHTAGLLAGAHILRVHDVKEAKEAVTLVNEIHKYRR
jgi:dihydropteroate synthase